MKRCLFTLPILLIGMASLVRADYFLLVINTNADPSKTLPSDIIGVLVEAENQVSLNREQKKQFDRGAALEVKQRNYTVKFSRLPAMPLLSLYAYNGPNEKPTDFHMLPNVVHRFEALRTEIKNKMPPKELAEWALTHGLVGKFVETMDKWVMDETAKTDPVAVNYLAIKAKLHDKMDDGDSPSKWVKRLETKAFKRETSEHYLALYNDDKYKVEVKSRLDRLEDIFKTFYYWNALQGNVLPVPRERLLVVINALAEDNFRAVNDGGKDRLSKRYEDGFFARREGILYLDLCREPNFEKLRSFVNNKLDNKKTIEAFLKDRPFPSVPGQPDLFALALAVKVLEADAERMTVSHHGARQLFYASGLLPRYVVAPEWIQYGVGSYFETPLGSPWTSPTAPSSLHLKIAVELLSKTGTNTGEILKQIVNDGYFREAASLSVETEAAVALSKARALSWALTYYLLKKEPTRFRAYREELEKMPRDLALDADTQLGCFARAIGAVDSEGKVDLVKMKKEFGDKWRDYLKEIAITDEKGIPLTGAPLADALQAEIKSYQDKLKKTPTP
jgi:hypothetical protein